MAQDPGPFIIRGLRRELAQDLLHSQARVAIQRSLQEITRHRTTLVIAHRLSTVRHADRIMVLERGRVVESGRHADLLARRGPYAALWRVQSGLLPAEVLQP